MKPWKIDRSTARHEDELMRILRQMFSDGVDVARSYGDNAFHLWGEQLERQFQIAYARVQRGEFTVQLRSDDSPRSSGQPQEETTTDKN